jgi:hypothetical protein
MACLSAPASGALTITFLVPKAIVNRGDTFKACSMTTLLQERRSAIDMLRTDGKSWAEIATALSLDKSYVWRVGTGRELSHPRRSPKNYPVYQPEVLKHNLAPVIQGGLSELEVAVELIKAGWEVWQPLVAQQRSDLAVFKNDKFIRIQVKTATWDAKHKRYRVSLTNKKRSGRRTYTADDCDVFVIKCGQSSDFYILPISYVRVHSVMLNLYPNRELCAKTEQWKAIEKYHNAFGLLDDLCG